MAHGWATGPVGPGWLLLFGKPVEPTTSTPRPSGPGQGIASGTRTLRDWAMIRERQDEEDILALLPVIMRTIRWGR